MTLRRGFTLIELVIVIAIIGILASLAIPKFIDISREAKIASAKAGLGTLRAILATKYAASATGGVPASYPTWIFASDYAFGQYVPNPINYNLFIPMPLAQSTTGTATSVDAGYWYVSSSSSPDYGKAGAYSNDPSIDTSGW